MSIQSVVSQNAIVLSSNVKIYVPSTVDIDQQIDNVDHYVNLVSLRFSSWFGGATVYDALGAWKSDQLNKVVYEPVKIVQAFSSDADLLDNAQSVLDLALTIKSELSQESVAVEFNNVLYLV